MRKQFCDAMVARASQPNLVFLTGDLGFMALEPLQQILGDRFINCGVAEQNLISVAAAMAREGLEPWVYSIAPFCYARPFEQIRNDVTFHKLPVKLVGNGGGYGYGVMGPTHHAIEDYGVLLTLPGMQVFIPAFDEDMSEICARAGNSRQSAYLRLGRGEAPMGYTVPSYKAWRCLVQGSAGVLIGVGPIVGSYIAPVMTMPEQTRPSVWVVSELPLADNPVPDVLLQQICASQHLVIAEEHVAHGGFASELILSLARQNLTPKRFMHHHAQAHHYARYGSQTWLRQQSSLDAVAVLSNF